MSTQPFVFLVVGIRVFHLLLQLSRETQQYVMTIVGVKVFRMVFSLAVADHSAAQTERAVFQTQQDC